VLNLTYTQVVAQPHDWVDMMMELHFQKSKAEEFENKKQEAKMKAQKKGMRTK